jgi:Cu(I)/Ag(I) efflux system membrane fusion protein
MFGLAIAAAIGAAYVAGRSSGRTAVPPVGARQLLYYVDPMHPAYRSDKPGKAPDCGMDLQPVYAGESGPPEPQTAAGIRLTPAQEQAVRLETEPVLAADGVHQVRTAGRVAADEALLYRVSAGADGWVRRLFSDRTGSHVKRGEALAAFFSKDISAPQQAYIYALESYERLRRMPSPPADPLALATQQLATARDNVRFLGMGEAQIEEVGRTRVEASDVNLTAPADGLILERHVSVGQRFMKGEPLYVIANLERVWVLADVHPTEAALGSVAKAWIRIDGLPAVEAKVAAAPAQFDEQGRTGKLRLEANNPRGILIPGMIVDVDLEAPAHRVLTVHADAVIDSGTSKRVFVALGDGHYDVREVQTGWQDGDRIEIRAGVQAGERVVTAGAFLLDSESRMKNPAGKVVDAECGMNIDRSSARRLDRNGTTYYFCSESCERKFAARRPQ